LPETSHSLQRAFFKEDSIALSPGAPMSVTL
jgi:hypothetical protein